MPQGLRGADWLTGVLPLQPREKGGMRFHKLQNVQIALDYLRHRQVRHPPGRRPRPLLRLACGCDRGPLAHR